MKESSQGVLRLIGDGRSLSEVVTLSGWTHLDVLELADEKHLMVAGDPLVEPVSSARRPDPALVRAWARREGITVGDRGRLPALLFTAYEEAHRAAQ